DPAGMELCSLRLSCSIYAARGHTCGARNNHKSRMRPHPLTTLEPEVAVGTATALLRARRPDSSRRLSGKNKSRMCERDDIKDVYAEMKGQGFDTKAIRTIVRLRKKDANERQEEEAMLDLYMAALGMA